VGGDREREDRRKEQRRSKGAAATKGGARKRNVRRKGGKGGGAGARGRDLGGGRSPGVYSYPKRIRLLIKEGGPFCEGGQGANGLFVSVTERGKDPQI